MARPGRKAFLYMDVYEQLRQSITAGELKPEEKLMSEEDMALKYHVSRITVKKALELLKDDGYIDRVQGRGTFVRPPQDHAPASADAPRPQRKTIGFVLEHVASPFGLDMLYQTDQLLRQAGYTLLIRFSYGSVEKETEEIEALLSMGIQALITMPCHNSYYNMGILKLILEQFPVVLVDKRMYGLPVPSVCTDGEEAICRLVEHLHERGCRNAALITIDPSSTTSLTDRVNGFYDGLKKTGMSSAGECVLPKRSENLLQASLQDTDYTARINDFLDSFEQLPDAFVLTEFALSRLLNLIAVQRGLRAGKDFKACGIDEDYHSPWGFLFTHMKQDENAIAQHVVDILLKRLAGEEVTPEAVRVPALFRQGQTT
ncbi:MAG: GntR family transcriptional regulator [Eubacteriales bacterium]|nr:GntR family transcriptional regulator [Eubacteriales bacterium]